MSGVGCGRATAMGEAKREQILEETYEVGRIEEHQTSFSAQRDSADWSYRACLSRKIAEQIGAKIGDRVILRTTVEVVRAESPESRPDALLIPFERVGVSPPYEQFGSQALGRTGCRTPGTQGPGLVGLRSRGEVRRLFEYRQSVASGTRHYGPVTDAQAFGRAERGSLVAKAKRLDDHSIGRPLQGGPVNHLVVAGSPRFRPAQQQSSA